MENLLNSGLGRVLLVLFSFILGGFAEWVRGRWKRHSERREVEKGRRCRTVEFVQVFVTEKEGQRRLHVNCLGTLPLEHFFPNQLARESLINWSLATEAHLSTVPMKGPLGSFVLRELHGLVRMVSPKSDFPLGKWLMVPVFETYRPIEFVTPTVLLVRLGDLAHFASFAACKDMLVLSGSEEGAKVLTLMEVYQSFQLQKKAYLQARAEGRSTRYLEQMWVVDLRLDTEVCEPNPEAVASGEVRDYRNIPWERFAADLERLGLQT